MAQAAGPSGPWSPCNGTSTPPSTYWGMIEQLEDLHGRPLSGHRGEGGQPERPTEQAAGERDGQQPDGLSGIEPNPTTNANSVTAIAWTVATIASPPA